MPYTIHAILHHYRMERDNLKRQREAIEKLRDDADFQGDRMQILNHQLRRIAYREKVVVDLIEELQEKFIE